MRKALFALSVVALTFMLSSCFVLQSFGLLAGAVNPGSSTKAQFKLRPLSTEPNRSYQFVLVGVPTGGDLKVGAATWDVKGTFDGPYKLGVSVPLPGALLTNGGCGASGLSLNDITDTTWKGFITPNKVRDKGLVSKTTQTDVGVKATVGATTGTNYTVFGITGVWDDDDGDGIVDADDLFLCTGIASSNLWVNEFPVVG